MVHLEVCGSADAELQMMLSISRTQTEDLRLMVMRLLVLLA